MRTTVDLDPYLLDRLRDEAHRRGVAFKDFLNAVVRQGLERRPAARPRPYRCPSFAMGAPLRPLDKALAIADALEDDEVARELALRR
ncbi:MAG: hypothetical protein KGL38_06345 [Gemmatimonadota bacterium]|nr:hypothetical protein [Gemmatimonadota bacterium]